MFVVEYKKLFTVLALVLVVLSVTSLFISGLNFSIDFTGGSVLEVSYDNRPEISEVEEIISNRTGGDYMIRPVGENGYSIRIPFVSDEERQEISGELSLQGTGFHENKISSVGPVIGNELKNKAFVAIGIVVLVIVLFVAFSFRKVSEPVSAWWYGLIAIITLFHDVMIPVGIFSVLQLDIDILFVTALLAILGYSVNDTIVVFDRIRENLKTNKELHVKESFKETVGKSLKSTFARSINTSMTTLIVLSALLIVTGTSIHNFIITLIIGVVAGTYSSIFLASPLLVMVNSRKRK
ncbi:MAG: protein translocase subunit SecF [Candidatus Pacebacteria bacterium]|nr:protein translocase subunit SecF [Candidatus Paceibacterota bacterium]